MVDQLGYLKSTSIRVNEDAEESGGQTGYSRLCQYSVELCAGGSGDPHQQ